MEKDVLHCLSLKYAKELYAMAYNLTLEQEKALDLTQEALELFCREQPQRVIMLARDQGLDKQALLDLCRLIFKVNQAKLAKVSVVGRWSELGPSSRAALYLKHYQKFSYNDLSYVFDRPASDLIAQTHKAREFLLQGREDLC